MNTPTDHYTYTAALRVPCLHTLAAHRDIIHSALANDGICGRFHVAGAGADADSGEEATHDAGGICLLPT